MSVPDDISLVQVNVASLNPMALLSGIVFTHVSVVWAPCFVNVSMSSVCKTPGEMSVQGARFEGVTLLALCRKSSTLSRDTLPAIAFMM